MQLLIGIDDTDNKESRGTGFRSRQLGHLLTDEGDIVSDITRHQLFVHDDIPYTSQNSSACLNIVTNDMEKVINISLDFLNEIAAEGSDVGLCVSPYETVSNEIIEWGRDAKKIVLNKRSALKLAEKNKIFLKGLTGSHDGIIGAMAAVGLRKWGNDGRCIWLKGKEIRDISGVFKISELKKLVAINHIQTTHGETIPEDDYINIKDWFRPVIRNGKIFIFADSKNRNNEWEIISKEHIKSISN